MTIKLTKPQQRVLRDLAKGQYCFNTATFHAKPYINLERLGLASIVHYGNWSARATITEAGRAYLAGVV